MTTKDPYEQVKEIYRLKGLHDGYLKSGDTANMEKAKNAAQPYYQELINNGYANVADDLSKSNYVRHAWRSRAIHEETGLCKRKSRPTEEC